MYSDDPEYAQHAVSVLLYRATLSVWARVISWVTECRSVYRNIAEAVVSGCSCFIVSSCVPPLILHCFFITLVGVLASDKH